MGRGQVYAGGCSRGERHLHQRHVGDGLVPLEPSSETREMVNCTSVRTTPFLRTRSSPTPPEEVSSG